jgi:hypothetical protein
MLTLKLSCNGREDIVYELAIGAISLAIAVGQVCTAPKKDRWTLTIVATIVGCALIVGIIAYQAYQTHVRDKHIAHVADLVLNVMDRPQTFDDIYNRLNFLPYGDVDEAFDFLFDNKLTEHNVVQIRGLNDQMHAVRLFRRKDQARN